MHDRLKITDLERTRNRMTSHRFPELVKTSVFEDDAEASIYTMLWSLLRVRTDI